MKFVGLLSAALILSGCASPTQTPDDLMSLPHDEVIEAKYVAAVPVSVAYRNIVKNARKCWQTQSFPVDADPYDSHIGYGRISVRLPAAMLQPNTVYTTVDLRPETDKTTQIHGRSLRNPFMKFAGTADLPSLQQWAEGKDVPCG